MLEVVADVGGEGVELVVRHLRPDASRQTAGAEVAEARARQMEVLQGLFLNVHVEGGMVGDDDVGFREVR